MRDVDQEVPEEEDDYSPERLMLLQPDIQRPPLQEMKTNSPNIRSVFDVEKAEFCGKLEAEDEKPASED